MAKPDMIPETPGPGFYAVCIVAIVAIVVLGVVWLTIYDGVGPLPEILDIGSSAGMGCGVVILLVTKKR